MPFHFTDTTGKSHVVWKETTIFFSIPFPLRHTSEVFPPTVKAVQSKQKSAVGRLYKDQASFHVYWPESSGV